MEPVTTVAARGRPCCAWQGSRDRPGCVDGFAESAIDRLADVLAPLLPLLPEVT